MSGSKMPATDLAHLAHVEVLADASDERPGLITRAIGRKLSTEENASADLRKADGCEFGSLKLTRPAKAGSSHAAFSEARITCVADIGGIGPRRRPRHF